MNAYTLYWLDGKREVVNGSCVADAMTSAGYGRGAVQALDFYVDGEDHEYEWDVESRSWHKIGGTVGKTCQECGAPVDAASDHNICQSCMLKHQEDLDVVDDAIEARS